MTRFFNIISLLMVLLSPLTSGCKNADTDETDKTVNGQREVFFSGNWWAVATAQGKPYGGPFYYSDSKENVWIDDAGKLHLKITYRNDKWYCSKVTLLKPVTYRKYVFQVDSRVDNFDKNVVGGLFTYKSDTQEVDIEFSKWGIDGNRNSQFVVQPGSKTENKKRYSMNLTGNESTHWFNWQPDRIEFASYRGHSDNLPDPSEIIQQWTYTGTDIPADLDDQVKINLWLFKGMPPSDNKETEMIISGFRIE